MPDSVSYSGPLLYLLFGVVYGSWGFSLFVVYDSLRRGTAEFGSRPRQLIWTIPQAVYLAIFTANQFPIPPVADYLGYVILALILPVIVQQVAYLLRVVFPSPKRLAMRAALSDEAEEAYIEEIVAAVRADEPPPEPEHADVSAAEDARDS